MRFLVVICSFILMSVPMLTIGQTEDENASDIQKGMPKYGTDSATCVMNISLYREFFKQWKSSDYKSDAVKDAIAPWRWVFLNCPIGTKNTYLDGVKIVDYLIKNETDQAKKDILIDTLMMVYDQRISYYGEEGYVLGRKGVDLFKLKPESFEDAYKIFKKSVDIEGEKSAENVIIYLFKTAEKMVKEGKSEKDLIVDTYDKVSDIIENNIKNAGDDNEKLTSWENVKGNIELSFEPYASCEDLIKIYTVKFNNNPDDVNLLKKITKILDRKNCTDNELFFSATEGLHKLDPTAKSALLMGKLMINKKQDYSNAAKYFKQAGELYEDNSNKADAYYFLALAYYQMKNYSSARTYCYKSLDYRPDNGNAYILIGDMYASSSNDCGGDEIATKAVFWAAVDKYAKAKMIDPSVSEIANKRIADYSRYFPTSERLFFYNLNKGDSYNVGCWIGESTNVRASD